MPGYIHGTAPDEQQRLSALNDLLNARTLEQIRPRPGERVLDVGSGLGQLSREIARAVSLPGGDPVGAPDVVGVEHSADQIAEAVRLARAAGEAHLVDFRHGDAADPPLSAEERASFDLVHARFVLEHVEDPLAVVRAMVAAVKPGGRIVISDDDHDVLRLYPEPAGVRELWNAYIRLYERNGNDPLVGRRLVWLLHAAGVRPVRNTRVWFGACSGNGEFEPIVWNMVHILEGARPALAAHALIGEPEFDRSIQELRRFAGRDDAAVWFAMALAEGRAAS